MIAQRNQRGYIRNMRACPARHGALGCVAPVMVRGALSTFFWARRAAGVVGAPIHSPPDSPDKMRQPIRRCADKDSPAPFQTRACV
jgi:hypothetical protein